MGTYILIAILVLTVLFIFSLYNRLIRRRNEVQNIFGSIDAMLKKRFDLIPNLIETVGTYMEHERTVLTEITEMRTKALSPGTNMEEKIDIQNKLNKSMGDILIAVEAYPDLKANQNFIQLQGSWNEVEEQISAARRAYNAAVTDYNNSVETIPTNIVAGILGFKRMPVLETPEHERQNISAKELFNSFRSK